MLPSLSILHSCVLTLMAAKGDGRQEDRPKNKIFLNQQIYRKNFYKSPWGTVNKTYAECTILTQSYGGRIDEGGTDNNIKAMVPQFFSRMEHTKRALPKTAEIQISRQSPEVPGESGLRRHVASSRIGSDNKEKA
ncbi:hypothetical protein EDD85DRAFT_791162 [Armillaria nabsnona]|nr:hypothetical protein EDD85DRAFT_791162 [Armillaria nabsnona]